MFCSMPEAHCMFFTLPSRIHHCDITDVCLLFKQESQQQAGNSSLTFCSDFLCSLALQPLLSHFAGLLFLCGCLKKHTHTLPALPTNKPTQTGAYAHSPHLVQ